jgi:lysophospholipase L1-like esterase
VIHFNWGLHDLCYRNPQAKTQGNRDKKHGKISVPLAQYRANMEKLVAALTATGARLIWASTTKVPEGEVGRVSGDEQRYNKAAQEIMARHHVAIDDLYALSVSLPPDLSLGEGNVHYTPEGYSRLAAQAAASIEQALARK